MKDKFKHNYSKNTTIDCMCQGRNPNCFKCEGTGLVKSYKSIKKNKQLKSPKVIFSKKDYKERKFEIEKAKISAIKDYLIVTTQLQVSKGKIASKELDGNLFKSHENIKDLTINRMKLEDDVIDFHTSLNLQRCLYCNEIFKSTVKNHFQHCYFIRSVYYLHLHEIVYKYNFAHLPERFSKKFTREQIIDILMNLFKSNSIFKYCPFCNCKNVKIKEHISTCRVVNKSDIKYLGFFIENNNIDMIRLKYNNLNTLSTNTDSYKSSTNTNQLNYNNQNRIERNLDAAKDYAFSYRENGKFGSHPSHDNYDD